MNPASRKGPSDNAKFRETYLANLALQASNNQKNQNANIIFKQTGAPPPTMADYRTTTDKFADIEGLKVLLRGKLASVTDGTIASQIAFSLNEDQLRFAVNAWPTIENDMKAKFAGGVPAPVFMAYLNRLMDTYEKNDFVDLGLSQSSNPTPSPNQILYTLNRGDLIKTLSRLIEKAGNHFGVDIREVLSNIKIQSLDYPSFKARFDALPEQDKGTINQAINELLETIVPDSYIPQMINSVDMVLQRNDKKAFLSVIEDINEQFELNEQERRLFTTIIRILQGRQVENEPRDLDEETEALFEEETKQREAEDFSVPSRPPLPEGVLSVEEFGRIKGTNKKGEPIYAITREQMARKLNSLLEQHKNITARTTTLYTSGNNSGKPIVLGAGAGRSGSWKRATESDGRALTGVPSKAYVELYANALRQIHDIIPEPEEEEREGGGGGGEGGEEEQEGHGDGLRRRRKSKMKGRGIAHLTEKEYEKPKVYSQFGRYFINKPKLIHSGIMALRLPSGNFVPHFPTQKVSLALKEVLKHLVSGSQPTYEAVAKMSDEDRDKLVDICRTCHIDMPSIPKSKKMDKDEQDDYRFEVLRGEIMAGNNSPVLVKEFKSLLLKFSRNGKVPRGQAHEILEELVAMGL